MASATVRINQETLRVLHDLAEQLDESMPKILARAVEAYRRQHILARTNAAYQKLQSVPDAWQEEQEERRKWDGTLTDGLNEE